MINRLLSDGALPLHYKAKRSIQVQSLSKTAKLDPTMEFRAKKRLWFCELPDSPDSSVCASSTNESDEDDFDCGAFNDRAN